MLLLLFVESFEMEQKNNKGRQKIFLSFFFFVSKTLPFLSCISN